MENEIWGATRCVFIRGLTGPMLARLARATLTREQMEAFTQAILDAKAHGLDQVKAAKDKYLELTGRTAEQVWREGGREAANKYLEEVKAEDRLPLPVIEPMRIEGWDV